MLCAVFIYSVLWAIFSLSYVLHLLSLVHRQSGCEKQIVFLIFTNLSKRVNANHPPGHFDVMAP